MNTSKIFRPIYFIALIVCSCLLYTACNREDEMMGPDEPAPVVDTTDLSCVNYEPIIPESFDLDLNGDSIVDYEIKYRISDIESATASAIYAGHLVPIENNEVLKSNSAPSLFLRNLDDIQSVVDSPLRWANSGSNILTYIEFSSIDLVWSKEWLPYSLADHSTYFLGLKLVNDNISEIGWIEFSIIKSDGTIDIIDKGVF